VVEVDRVEAFKIGPKGGLTPNGRTAKRPSSGPHDVAVSTNRTMLYVPDRSRSRIVGHRIDANGRPEEGSHETFATCIQGEIGEGFQNLIATANRLYVSSSGGSGRIQVFGILPDGTLSGGDDPQQPITADKCAAATSANPRPDATPPLSERRKIANVKSFEVVGDILYAEDRGRKRIRAFRLTDGNFDPPTFENPNKPKKKTWQQAETKTKHVAQYQMILHHGSALLATQFFHGRIDSYLLDAGALPNQPTVLSNDDLRFTPVRLTADQDVVYVPTGEFDRIVAYRLNDKGVLKERDPFSQTNEQKGSFPNDAAVAVLTAGCD